MSDRPKKTLDQIVNDTLSSNFGISDEDLQLLFEDSPPATAPTPTPAAATPSVETVTPMPPPAEPTAPVVDGTVAIPPTVTPEPPKVGETAPDDKYESSLKATKEQIDQLRLAVQELLQKSQAKPPETDTAQPNPIDEIDDQAVIEKPKETILKLIDLRLKNVLPAAFLEYDSAVTTRTALDKFRKDHSDFDELRPLMRQIVAENPSKNDNPAALPRIYEEAKKRKGDALEAMKKELGFNPTPPVPPAPSPTPQPSVEDLLTKVEQRLRDKIRQRRNASGTLTNDQSTPVLPSERQNPRMVEKPKTEEEKIFDEMLEAGPPSTQFLRGLELIAKK